ncbi:hypothetical protein H7H48_19610 [Nitratireductor sp. B36]|uniref:hypothetical protein n=1 Tax=Nitratireductor sp. B36 TaxID=2762059 RepID=UPI001E5472BF|nr:hypothetical protein [Nitratireductor sp. B36]MCC5781277.1 hypothetical protein [Nitratireductor sp. B36]
MTYSPTDFQELNSELTRTLQLTEDDAKPCQLYDCEMPEDHQTIKLQTGERVCHVADACNLASSLQGISCLLRIPISENDCTNLSRVLVRELGCLWEMIDAAVQEQRRLENSSGFRGRKSHRDNKPAGKLIKLWADVLKHPKSAVVAHQCFDRTEATFIIDSDELRKLEAEMKIIRPEHENSSDKAWGIIWRRYAGEIVFFTLPEVDEIKKFIVELNEHYDYLIQHRRRLAKHLSS